MGQRHQIMVVLPKVYYNPDNCNNKPVRIIAIHHQWLYGKNVVLMLEDFIKFFRKLEINAYKADCCKLPYVFSNDEGHDILATSYSICKESGYYHRTHKLSYVHPDSFDNNDGVTLIDLRNPNNIKYCIFAIDSYGWECENGESIKPMKPYTAKKYLEMYKDKYEMNVKIKKLNQKEFNKIMEIAKKQDKKLRGKQNEC